MSANRGIELRCGKTLARHAFSYGSYRLAKILPAPCIDDVVRATTVAHGIREFIVDVPTIGLPGDGDAKSGESAVGGSASTRASKQRLLRR